MKLFKKNKKLSEQVKLDTIAGKIAGFLMYVQLLFAKRMEKIFSSMPLKKVKVLLVVFCIVSGGSSIYFFIRAIAVNSHTAFKIEQVHVPQHYDRTGDDNIENEVTEGMYLQLQRYKLYMDSLGQPIRPSLRDSIALLEEIYLQQKK